MAKTSWYQQKMLKLKKCKVAEMKERNAISAIDYDNEQEDWLNNPILREKSEAPKHWQSLQTDLKAEWEAEKMRKYGPTLRAVEATLRKYGYA